MYTMLNNLKSVVAKRAAVDKSKKAVKGFEVVHNRIGYRHCYNDNLFEFG